MRRRVRRRARLTVCCSIATSLTPKERRAHRSWGSSGSKACSSLDASSHRPQSKCVRAWRYRAPRRYRASKGLGHKRGGRVVDALLKADPRPQLYRLGRVHLVDRLREGDGLDMMELDHCWQLVGQHRLTGALDSANLQPAEFDGAWRVAVHAAAVAHRGVLVELGVLRQVVLQVHHRVQLPERT